MIRKFVITLPTLAFAQKVILRFKRKNPHFFEYKVPLIELLYLADMETILNKIYHQIELSALEEFIYLTEVKKLSKEDAMVLVNKRYEGQEVPKENLKPSC